MNANPAIDHSQTMLNRIVALLFALADLAEQAGGRSRAVRALILWMLRPAEAAARQLAMDVYGEANAAPVPLLQDGDSSTAAIRLALSFRALAMALASLPEWAFDGDDLQAADRWLRPVAACFGALHEVCEALRHMLAPAHCDTS